MALDIDKPKRTAASAKGLPPSIDEPIKQKNLNVPSTSDLVPLSLAIDSELKKELKITSAETGIPIVQILIAGYHLWKENQGRV